MFGKILALLDHRWLTRYGNLRSLVSGAGVGVFLLTAVIVALVSLFTAVGPVPQIFLGIALIILGLVVIQKVQQRRHTWPGSDDDLDLMLYNAHREEREKAIKRMAEEEVRRELKRLK